MVAGKPPESLNLSTNWNIVAQHINPNHPSECKDPDGVSGQRERPVHQRSIPSRAVADRIRPRQPHTLFQPRMGHMRTMTGVINFKEGQCNTGASEENDSYHTESFGKPSPPSRRHHR